MPITAETPNYDDSPWYKLVEEKAVAWNQFALDLNVEIDGYFNAWGLEFIIQATINNRDVEFQGIRTLESPAASFYFPIKDKIVEELVIWIDNPNYNSENSFRVRKRKLKNSVLSLFGNFGKKIKKDGFLFEFNSEFCMSQMLNLNLLGFENLNKVELNEDGFLLGMYYLPTQLETHKRIVELVNVISKL